MDTLKGRMKSLVGLVFILLMIEQVINAQQHIHIYQLLTIVTVPTIFFAVGYFIDSTRSFSHLLLNGIKKMVIPYVITSIVIMALNILASQLSWIKQPFSDVKTIIKTFAYGIGWPTDTLFGQSSFGVGLVCLLLAIFFATLIFNLVTKLKKSWLMVIAIIMLTAAGYWFRTIVQLPWSLEAALIAQPFMYFGSLIKDQQKMPMTLATFFVGIILWSISSISGAFDFTVAYNPHPIFGTIASLFAVSVIYVFHDRVIYQIKPLQIILKYLGDHFILGLSVATLVLLFIQINSVMANVYTILIVLISIAVIVMLQKLILLIKK
jgi:fucose 4-O-acetylase-like acetyltransferase